MKLSIIKKWTHKKLVLAQKSLAPFLVKFQPFLEAADKKLSHYVPKELKKTRIFLLGVSAVFLMCLVFLTYTLFIPLPAIDDFHNRQVPQSTKIYDRTGKVLLYDIHGEMRRTEISLTDVSPHLVNATIAIEDQDFYKHHGFRPVALMRALKENLSSRKYEQGGSTITQQVVKNTLLTNKKTIPRKVKEIILAVRLERKYTKEQILETYLNETPYGGILYGVEEASQYYYGVHANEVTLAEAAYLAALPKGPTYYSPYGPNKAQLDYRKNSVLSEMKKQGYITEEEYQAALAEEVEFQERTSLGIRAPHFVFYIKQKLIEKYGQEAVDQGGLKVITTLDWDLQEKAEEVVTRRALANAKRLNAENAGLVAVDPKTGQILAMVGSRGYFDKEIDGKVNIALAKRQPGSSFKPFAYATAFAKGYTPETVVFDLKTQFSTSCRPDELITTSKCYAPSNYGEKIHGPISMRSALAQSVNIASVKTLYLAGITNSINTAKSMGLTTLTDANRYGLTLVLGGGEVTLLEMTAAYGVFANEGVRNETVGILAVEDREGNVMDSYTASSTVAISSNVARTISDILSDNPARAPEFGWNSQLYFPDAQVAAKTGTTNDFRDAWIVGYTGGIAIGVWAGNNDNTPMIRRVAEASAAPMWHEVMDYAMEKYPSVAFRAPDEMSDVASLHPVLRGEWNSNQEAGIHDILYWVNKNNPTQILSYNPENDPQFEHWEYPVQVWASQYLTPEPEPEATSTEPVLEEATLVSQTGTTSGVSQ